MRNILSLQLKLFSMVLMEDWIVMEEITFCGLPDDYDDDCGDCCEEQGLSLVCEIVWDQWTRVIPFHAICSSDRINYGQEVKSHVSVSW